MAQKGYRPALVSRWSASDPVPTQRPRNLSEIQTIWSKTVTSHVIKSANASNGEPLANDDQLTPEENEIRRFLDFFSRPSGWALISIDPSDSVPGRKTRAVFIEQRDLERGVAWATEQNRAGKNVYHVPAIVEPAWRGPNPPLVGEIIGTEYIVADLDVRVGEDFAEDLERIRSLLTTRRPEQILPPTGIIYTGNGFQAYWKLSIIASGPEMVAVILCLANEIGGDHIQNPNRMLRVAGTVNWTNAVKQKRGRTSRLSKIERWDSAVSYTLNDFPTPPMHPPTPSNDEFAFRRRTIDLSELEELGVPTSTRALIVQGRDALDLAKYTSRSEALFAAILSLLRHRVPDDVVFAVITDPNYPISQHVLDQKNPNKCAARQIQRAHEKLMSPELVELNDRHAVISATGGKCRIVRWDTDPADSSRTIMQLQTVDDFANAYANRTISDGKQETPLARWWLRHPKRRQYNGIVYLPGKDEEVGGFLNLWRGFAVTPRRGTWTKLREHLVRVLADNDSKAAEYIFKWAAWAVQNPGTRAEVALVLRGERGTGKGTFGNLLKEIFGRHGIQISSAKQVSGNFNAHLRDVSFLFADEAYWPGNKGDEGGLKRLITEPTIAIEAKGRDVEEFPNCLHILFASNEDWVVPAGSYERRFAVFDVSSEKMQDHQWFSEISDELENGGREAFLFDALNTDLVGFHPRQIYKTSALIQQGERSMSPEDEWLMQLLQNGRLPQPLRNPARCKSEDLVSHARRSVPTLLSVPERRLGIFLRTRGCEPFTDGKKRGWEFPPLSEARAAMEKRLGGAVTWDHPTISQWQD
jgi:hypothetical protein